MYGQYLSEILCNSPKSQYESNLKTADKTPRRKFIAFQSLVRRVALNQSFELRYKGNCLIAVNGHNNFVCSCFAPLVWRAVPPFTHQSSPVCQAIIAYYVNCSNKHLPRYLTSGFKQACWRRKSTWWIY